MKTRFGLLAGVWLLLASGLSAEDAPLEQDALAESKTLRTSEQLDELLGPLALFPDALVAVVLPAATVPEDIVLAARFLADDGEASAIDEQGWDESVASLARYPDLLQWLDENLDWTKQVGQAFVDQPADVLKTIQHLRALAKAAGNLEDTPEQEVVVDGDTISIAPARDDVIYVPYYDASVVYARSRPYHADPYVTFGSGFWVGPWLSYGCDWRGSAIWRGDRRHRPDGDGWRRPHFPRDPSYAGDSFWQPWRPRSSARYHRLPRYGMEAGGGYAIMRPRPLPDWPFSREARREARRAKRWEAPSWYGYILRDGPRDDSLEDHPDVPEEFQRSRRSDRDRRRQRPSGEPLIESYNSRPDVPDSPPEPPASEATPPPESSPPPPPREETGSATPTTSPPSPPPVPRQHDTEPARRKSEN